MILRSITTRNFRNLAGGQHEFHRSANILIGHNGQGKTNLLEAIYFVATTKSFRTSRVGSVVQFGTGEVFVSGLLERGGILRTQSIGFASGDGRNRLLMLSGQNVGLTTYVTALNVFAYSQARLEIIRGGPEERRRFLDRGISSVAPGYLDQLTRFARVLRQRNALLHAIAQGAAGPATLDAWNQEFVAAAEVVSTARARYCRDLAEVYREVVEEYGYHIANLEFRYERVGKDEDLGTHLERIRRLEIRAQRSLAGPQRDELDLLLDGRPAEEVLSGGESKMIVLFLKLAKVELFRRRFEELPIFLLDDLDAELDTEILQKLLVRLPSRTQVFATSAKEHFLNALQAGPHRRLTIENGQVTGERDFA